MLAELLHLNQVHRTVKMVKVRKKVVNLLRKRSRTKNLMKGAQMEMCLSTLMPEYL